MKNENEFTIVWTDGNFEKSWTAKTFKEAQSIAKNSDYFPMEINDYRDMEVIILGGKEDVRYTYDELNNL